MEPKIQGKAKTREYSLLAPLECFHFRHFASARLGLQSWSSTQRSASWILVTPPSASTTAVSLYHHCCRPLPLLTPPLAATTAVSSLCCRLRPLSPLPSTVASVNCRRRRPLPPSLKAAPAAAQNCCQPLLLLTLPLAATATAAAFGICHRWSLPPPPSTAASVNRRRPPLPLPPDAPAAARHGCPGAPMSTSIVGKGSGDRGNTF